MGNLPNQILRSVQPVSKSASHLKNGGDWETVNENGGAERDRTADPLLAKQVLSQLSYSPTYVVSAAEMVGLGRFELPTSPLSGVRSNQLSYRPMLAAPAPTTRLKSREIGDSQKTSFSVKRVSRTKVEYAEQLRRS